MSRAGLTRSLRIASLALVVFYLMYGFLTARRVIWTGLLCIYFFYFDFQLIYVGRSRPIFTGKDFWFPVIFGDDSLYRILTNSDPQELRILPGALDWAMMRTVLVMGPIFLQNRPSESALNVWAAIGLILLLSPFGLSDTQLVRNYSIIGRIGYIVGGAINTTIRALIIGVVLWVINAFFGKEIDITLFLLDLNALPEISGGVMHGDVVRASAWIIALIGGVTKSFAWAAVAESNPDKYEPGIKYFAFGLTFAYLALCFVDNYTRLLHNTYEGHVGIIMLIGFIFHRVTI